ncbi:MAG: hypothetical protein GXO10_07100 [Crenarchaeota archaeon]|nr:hypothetical protein [Thermoproteota archaeon]
MVREIVTLEFSPVDPIYVGSSGEFSPETRGPATLGRSLAMPLPSTVLGSFLNLAYRSKHVCTDGTLSALYEALCELSQKERESICVRGPYLKYGSNIATLIDYHVTDLYVNSFNISNNFRCYVEYCMRKMLGIVERKEPPSLRFVKTLESIGIGLRRPVKAVYPENEGLIYSIERVDLLSVSNYESEVSVSMDIVDRAGKDIFSNVKDILQERNIVKFGGEGKIAKLSIEDGKNSLTEANLKQLEKARTEDIEYIILLIISPAVLRIYDSDIITIEDVKRDLLLEDNRVIENSILVGKGGKSPVSLISLGYNTVKNVRRPLRLCVVPGSFIIVRDVKSIIDDLYRYVIEGLGDGPLDPATRQVKARYLGYGTVAVLPISKHDVDTRSLIDKLFEISKDSQSQVK